MGLVDQNSSDDLFNFTDPEDSDTEESDTHGSDTHDTDTFDSHSPAPDNLTDDAGSSTFTQTTTFSSTLPQTTATIETDDSDCWDCNETSDDDDDISELSRTPQSYELSTAAPLVRTSSSLIPAALLAIDQADDSDAVFSPGHESGRGGAGENSHATLDQARMFHTAPQPIQSISLPRVPSPNKPPNSQSQMATTAITTAMRSRHLRASAVSRRQNE